MAIAEDIVQGFLRAFLADGLGYAQKYVSTGKGVNRIAENQNRIFPRLTIVNHGASDIRWGYGGAGTILLPGGVHSSATITEKNPVKEQLVFDDLGVSGLEVDVYS